MSLTGAILSPCGKYRYALWRQWDAELPSMTWVMLNPSTADANQDDATIRICKGRAVRTGYGAIYVVNLFAYRATHPKDLAAVPFVEAMSEPGVPRRNDEYIDTYARRSDIIVCAWGRHGQWNARGKTVLQMLRLLPILQPVALRLTQDGEPCHPLRVSYDTPLMPI